MSSKFDKTYNEKIDKFNEFVKREHYRDSRGRLVVKNKATRKGYRVKMVNGKPTEVRMTTAEQRNRSKAAKMSALRRYKKHTVKKNLNKLAKLR